MGQWRITIEGTGCHHNGKPDIDSNEKAKEYVHDLIGIGQNVTKAEFTVLGAKLDSAGVIVPDDKTESIL